MITYTYKNYILFEFNKQWYFITPNKSSHHIEIFKNPSIYTEYNNEVYSGLMRMKSNNLYEIKNIRVLVPRGDDPYESNHLEFML